MNRLPGLDDGRLKDLAPLRHGPLSLALEALNGDGEETRLVGGAVRDLALGASNADFDLATTALPDEVIRRARSAGFKVALTGLSHGTVTLIVQGQPIEATTLRSDVETDGRHAKVVFGRDFLSDALRRDFTINSLSLGADGTVHDPLGGIVDLASGRVRFIGDADQRIREDYLRILRFFRFSARFGQGRLDAGGLRATIRGRAGMARLSRERVRAELLKLMIAPHAGPVVRVMGECGFLEPLFAGMAYPGRLERLIAIESARLQEADGLLRLAALAVITNEDADRIRESLRLSRSEHDRLTVTAAVLPRLQGIEAAPSFEELRALMFEFGRDAARDALVLAQANSEASPADPAFLAADGFLADASIPTLPVTAADIIARGVAEGPRVGEALRLVRQKWMRARFASDGASLDRILVEALTETEPRP